MQKFPQKRKIGQQKDLPKNRITSALKYKPF
jgi:hypothetical protein